MDKKRYKTSDSFSRSPRTQYNQNEMSKGLKIPAGIYRGIVVDVEDPSLEGRIKVQIMKFYGTFPIGESSDPQTLDPEKYLGSMWCRTMLPMGSGTSSNPGAETSYGFSGIPPDINNEVVVAFGGDTHNGICLGVILDPGRNEGLAGAGARGPTADGDVTARYEQPSSGQPNDLPNEHPQAEAYRRQGLENDIIRGPSNSSPRRDASPRVAGVTTPAGHALTLDDGNGEDGSELGIRLRSAGGAQILMDDTNGMTYINNRDGSVWMEMNRNGDVDIFAAGSINMHTPGSFNLHAGADFNLHAIGNINMRGTNIGMESLGGFDALSVGNMNLTSESNGNLNMSGNLRVTAGRIDLNGPEAETAEVATPGALAGNSGVTESIAERVPEGEPWAGHLDVAQQIPDGGGTGGGGGGGGAGGGGGGGGGRSREPATGERPPSTSPAPRPELSPPTSDAGGSPGSGRAEVTYNNQGATRNQPIQPLLMDRLQTSISDVYGPGYRAEIYSGGQPPIGTSNRRTGTIRHDNGYAADIYIYDPSGNRLRSRSQLAPLRDHWRSNNYGSFGMVMRGGGVHADLWGGNGGPSLRGGMGYEWSY